MNRPSPSRTRAIVAALALSAALCSAPGVARATAIESYEIDRIVALVSQRPIFLSEIRERVGPMLRVLHDEVAPGPERERAEAALHEQMLERVIEETLLEMAASLTAITVTLDEIDAALHAVAEQNGASVPELLIMAARQGLDHAAYRAELGRQILEVKVLRVHLGPKQPLGLDEAGRQRWMMEAKRRWLSELRTRAHLTVVARFAPRSP